MTQDPNADAYFTLKSGVNVTVTLSAVKTACLTDAAFDGTQLLATIASPAVYRFQPQGVASDRMIFAAGCMFADGDPVDAHYTIAVTSDDGGNFKVSSVSKPRRKDPRYPKALFQLYFTIA